MNSQQDKFKERASRLGAKAGAKREENRQYAEARRRAENGGFLSQKRVSGRVFAMVVPLLLGLFILGPLMPNILVTLGYDQERLLALLLKPRRLVFFGILAFAFFGFVRNHPQALALGSFVMGTIFGAVLVIQYTEQVIEIEKMIGLEGHIIPEQEWVSTPSESIFETDLNFD